MNIFSQLTFPLSAATWLSFFIATLFLCVSPGPGALSSMAAGLRYGFARGMLNCLGLQAAIIVNVFIIWLGLGALLMASTFAFDLMKYGGAAYLIYLGIQKFRETALAVDVSGSKVIDTHDPAWKIFRQGFWVNLTNPKGMVFLLAVLPQFIDVTRPTAPQYGVLAITMVTVDVVVMACYTGFAAKVLAALNKPKQIQWTNRVLGSLFIAAGCALMLFQKAERA
jgi:homoserine/homoserine lactone efflux protein